MMQDIWSSGVVAVAASCLNNNFDTQPGATDLDKWDGIFSVRDTIPHAFRWLEGSQWGWPRPTRNGLRGSLSAW